MLPRVGDFHHVDMRGIEQPVGVLLEAENRGPDLGLVSPDAFEYGQPVMEGVRQDVRVCIAPGHQFPVVPDLPVTVSHGHAEILQIVFVRCCELGYGVLHAGHRAKGYSRFRLYRAAVSHCLSGILADLSHAADVHGENPCRQRPQTPRIRR